MLNANINQQVLARAIKDAAFRQALLSNPKAVLAREFNIHFPESVIIRMLEDTPTAQTIVLPPQEAGVFELSDAELEAVAGASMPVSGSAAANCVTCGSDCN